MTCGIPRKGPEQILKEKAVLVFCIQYEMYVTLSEHRSKTLLPYVVGTQKKNRFNDTRFLSTHKIGFGSIISGILWEKEVNTPQYPDLMLFWGKWEPKTPFRLTLLIYIKLQLFFIRSSKSWYNDWGKESNFSLNNVVANITVKRGWWENSTIQSVTS